MKKPFACFALLLLLGCPKNTPAPEPNGNPAETPPAAAACQSDADCVVSCSQPQNCCDQLCPPCAQVFTKDAFAANEQWKSQNCAAVSCPVAKCMAPTEDTVARCTSGQCTIERVPAANP